MQELCGTPFVTLPGINDHKAVAATIADGTPYGRNITFEHLEQVYNDSLLMDAISNWGEDGPLYEQTLDAGELQVFRLARDLFAGVPIPAALQRPPQ